MILLFTFAPKESKDGTALTIKWLTNHTAVKRAMAEQKVTSPGSEVAEDNGCGVGGNFLPQARGVCGVCLRIIWRQHLFPWWPGTNWTNDKQGDLLPDGRRRLLWLSWTDPGVFPQITEVVEVHGACSWAYSSYDQYISTGVQSVRQSLKGQALLRR